MVKKVLTISGSDSSGAGGMQADLRTFAEYGVFGVQALTCITSIDEQQNFIIDPVPTALLYEQLTSIFAMYPDLAAIKIGMLGNQENLKLVANLLKKKSSIPLIVDPVLAFKETAATLAQPFFELMRNVLLPLAFVTTPNLVEAELLADIPKIGSIPKMKQAAKKIQEFGVENVVIKGGQRIPGATAVDLLLDNKKNYEFRYPKLDSHYINGAGCTFAAGITAGIAKGMPIKKAVELAKEFVFAGIADGCDFSPELGNVWQGAYREKRKEKFHEKNE